MGYIFGVHLLATVDMAAAMDCILGVHGWGTPVRYIHAHTTHISGADCPASAFYLYAPHARFFVIQAGAQHVHDYRLAVQKWFKSRDKPQARSRGRAAR